jgi:hypothetical protein
MSRLYMLTTSVSALWLSKYFISHFVETSSLIEGLGHQFDRNLIQL